jgi:hypothetical protein
MWCWNWDEKNEEIERQKKFRNISCVRSMIDIDIAAGYVLLYLVSVHLLGVCFEGCLGCEEVFCLVD